VPNVLWIKHPDALRQRLDGSLSRIGLDTEFVRDRTYWPVLALVQMAVADEILLIDPLEPGMTDALTVWLTAPNLLKIMHSAGEDLIAFKHTCGVVPAPLYDTQVAASLSGLGNGLGYQKLVEQITGITLPKGETRSDWLYRPLTPAQQEYAADDVRYLFELHNVTMERLEELGRLPWLQEDCERMLTIARRDGGERWPHLSQRSAQLLDAPAQHRLLRLLRWRDAQACASNKPRNWVLNNDLLLQLARHAPLSSSALQQQLDAQPKAPRKLGRAIWQALTTELPDETDMPLAKLPSDNDKRILKRLQHAVAAHSAELALADGILASRKHLETLLEQGWTDSFGQWRRKELEPILRPLLADRLQGG
jgi:ribonuclease D